MLTNILLQVFNGIWMMEANAAHAYAPLVKSLVNRQSIDITGVNESVTRFASLISSASAAVVSPSYNGFTGKYELAPTQTGSIAVIPLMGAVMKQDYCGALGTRSIVSLFQSAQQNPNINGVILYTDSPGELH